MNKIDQKEYCATCDQDITYNIRTLILNGFIKGINFKYKAEIPICMKCGEEIYIINIEDKNVEESNRQYRMAAGLITTEEIQQLLETYDIKAKPLSQLLGWGDKSIGRYLEGKTPTREYSDRLITLMNSKNMQELLDLNEDRISPKAVSKIREKLKNQRILATLANAKLDAEAVALFFQTKVNSTREIHITPLKLQKLLYYSQAWFMSFFDKELFEDKFCAWAHGPVIPSIYHKYKGYGYGTIDTIHLDNVDLFTEDAINTLEMVWDVYGKYDGKYLEALTHAEHPWREVRKDIAYNESCSDPIEPAIIKEYYKTIRITHNIKTTQDLNVYVSSISPDWN